MKFAATLIASLFSCFFALHASAGQAVAVSADDAQAAVSQGAHVLDVRTAAQFAAGHLPQASAVPAQAAQLALTDLAALLSQAGVDSSRTMLVVGDAGDANAQALWQRLAQVTSGRVLWLVGGVQEWQMRGHALSLDASSRPTVPQYLAPFDAPAQNTRMAGSKVRTSALLERNLPVQLALN
jgi:rhodanese-related sulfurtransferase